MLHFFTLGPSEIDITRFKPVENSSITIKPLGGLWATVYCLDNPHYNDWVDYLTRNIYLLFYKYPSKNPFVKNGLLLNLNDDANIFYLRNYQDFLFLQNNYPRDNGYFDYEALSYDFDGLFVDILTINRDYHFSNEQKKAFDAFGVNSLILFNLNPIISYQKSELEFDPFDYELPDHFINYRINVENNVRNLAKSRSLKRG